MLPNRRYNQFWLSNLFDDDSFWKMEKSNLYSPSINVIENDNEYRVEVAAPGMSKDDFRIRINEDNQLVVSMEHKDESKKNEEENERYLRREFSYSQFEQTLLLPEDIVLEDVKAIMKNGVLTITLPKIKEVPRIPEERVIDIQ